MHVRRFPPCLESYRPQAGRRFDRDRPGVDGSVAGRRRTSIEAVADRGARGLGPQDHADRLIVEAALMAERNVGHHRQEPSIVRGPRCRRQGAPVVRAVGIATPGDIARDSVAHRLIDPNALRSGQQHLLCLCRDPEVGMERRRRLSPILPGGPDQQEISRLDDDFGKDPLEGVVGPVGQSITSQIDGGRTGIVQLDPVLEIAVLIRQHRPIRGHDLVDAHPGLCRNRSSGEEHQERNNHPRPHRNTFHSSILGSVPGPSDRSETPQQAADAPVALYQKGLAESIRRATGPIVPGLWLGPPLRHSRRERNNKKQKTRIKTAESANQIKRQEANIKIAESACGG